MCLEIYFHPLFTQPEGAGKRIFIHIKCVQFFYGKKRNKMKRTKRNNNNNIMELLSFGFYFYYFYVCRSGVDIDLFLPHLEGLIYNFLYIIITIRLSFLVLSYSSLAFQHTNDFLGVL